MEKVDWPQQLPPYYSKHFNTVPFLTDGNKRTTDPLQSNGIVKSGRPQRLKELLESEGDSGLPLLLAQQFPQQYPEGPDQVLRDFSPRQVYSYANTELWNGRPMFHQALCW
jgi:hypothetical protein